MIEEEVWGKTISLLSIVAMSTLVKVWNYYWKECSLGRNAATVDIRLWKSRHTIDNDLYLEGSPFQAQFGHFLLNFLTLHFSHPNSLSKSTSISLCFSARFESHQDRVKNFTMWTTLKGCLYVTPTIWLWGVLGMEETTLITRTSSPFLFSEKLVVKTVVLFLGRLLKPWILSIPTMIIR